MESVCWEEKISLRLEALKTKLLDLTETDDASLTVLIKETVKDCAVIIKEEVIPASLDATLVPIVVEALKKLVIPINDILLLETSLGLAVKIPLNPLRVEFRLISLRYVTEGKLPFIENFCPESETGECVATIYLASAGRVQ